MMSRVALILLFFVVSAWDYPRSLPTIKEATVHESICQYDGHTYRSVEVFVKFNYSYVIDSRYRIPTMSLSTKDTVICPPVPIELMAEYDSLYLNIKHVYGYRGHFQPDQVEYLIGKRVKVTVGENEHGLNCYGYAVAEPYELYFVPEKFNWGPFGLKDRTAKLSWENILKNEEKDSTQSH
mgnify:CR=1 FL=1